MKYVLFCALFMMSCVSLAASQGEIQVDEDGYYCIRKNPNEKVQP